MLRDKRIGVIGAGIMGRALISGMLENGLSKDRVWATVKTESSRRKAEDILGMPVHTDIGPLVAGTDVIIVAVKPHTVPEVLERVVETGDLSPDTLVVCIAAGVTTEDVEDALGTSNPVVRAMPNTPCQVRKGVTVLSPGSRATGEHMALARAMFESVGYCIELPEYHMDAVTGLSASGPAFIYLIMEALADGGVKVGLPRDVALDLVTHVVLGSAEMIRQTGRHPAALKDEVTTPAGCTIGAVLTLEDGKIRSVLARAVEEAARIACRLG